MKLLVAKRNMAADKLVGKTKFIATKVVVTPDGTPLPSTESPRSISRPWRHCKRVRSRPRHPPDAVGASVFYSLKWTGLSPHFF